MDGDYAHGQWNGLSNSGAGTTLGNSGNQSALSTGAYITPITINGTGLALIDKTGGTGFGLVYGSDMDRTDTVLNTNWGSGQRTRILFSASDETGTGQDPKLDVTHAAGGIRNPFGGPMVLRNPLGA